MRMPDGRSRRERFLRKQLRALAGRIQMAREEERAHAAREIHDVLAQELTALKMDMVLLNRRLAAPIATWDEKTIREKVAGAIKYIEAAGESVQSIATSLRPVVLDSLGLCAAVEWVASDFEKRTEIPCKAYVPDGRLNIDDDCSTALFRILQESLANILRHANATQVVVHLSLDEHHVKLSVVDNGRGVSRKELKDPHSVGLLGMRERASLLRGKCVIKRGLTGGTIVRALLPIKMSLKTGKKHE